MIRAALAARRRSKPSLLALLFLFLCSLLILRRLAGSIFSARSIPPSTTSRHSTRTTPPIRSSTPPPNSAPAPPPNSAPTPLVASASESRQQALLNALNLWQTGMFPRPAAALAAACPPADAAAVALRLAKGVPNVVLDVGANQGHPVTLFALKHGTRVVVSVEPDPRNIEALRRRAAGLVRSGGQGSRFVAVHGAAGDEAGVKNMMFHRTRNDFSCFTCLDKRKEEIFSKAVRVDTVDRILGHAGVGEKEEVSLLKTDTQGFERQVLDGAKGVFGRGKVAAVIVEFDPKLLGRKENAVGVLERLVSHGMQCVHLAFSGRKDKKTDENPTFEDLPITTGNKERFYDFVIAQGGWTDLFCLRGRAMTISVMEK